MVGSMSVKKYSSISRAPPEIFPGGSVVWARRNDNQFWPARVVDIEAEPDVLLLGIPSKHERVVKFFDSDVMAILNTSEIVRYVCGMPANGNWPSEMADAVRQSNEYFLGLLPLLPNGKRFRKLVGSGSWNAKRARPSTAVMAVVGATNIEPKSGELEMPVIEDDMGGMAVADVERIQTELEELTKVSKQLHTVILLEQY